MGLLPHEQRVVDEKTELDSKLEKLKAFLKTDIALGLPFDDRCLLVKQATVMTAYSGILGKRIERFTTKGA